MLRLLAGIPKLEAPLHDLAGLSCADHGGPSNDHAAEMVYWSDIPSDADFKSPIGANDKSIKYLTFEPDGGGFNNIRDKMVNSEKERVVSYKWRAQTICHRSNATMRRRTEKDPPKDARSQ
jgi:hypothetical protein